ncbi:type II secretion system F family protein [Patescibacteria group bacterium]|nr:type II secretion system F family protein [Patescibacteria group bacterium]
MAIYLYRAHTADAKSVRGEVEAPDPATAARILRDRQLFISEIHEKKERITTASIMDRFKKVSSGDVANFTRQLATMVVAGLMIPDALTILRNQTTNPAFIRVLSDIEHQIDSGGNLADSLGKYPAVFTPIYIALVRAGESSGTLDQVLTRLAETLEAQREFQNKVKGAMIYPVIIVIGMVLVVGVMMTVVIPRLTDMYKDFGMELPASTQFLINLSHFFVQFWWLMILLAFGGTGLFRRWRRTPAGQLIVDSLILKIPLFGNLTKKILLVEFTRTLGMLVGSGIHIINGLQILRDSLGNVLFRNAIDEIAKKIEKGFPLGDSFGQFDIFPPIVAQMMKIGEETGKLDETLTKLSKYFESESEHLVEGLTTAIEPIIMVVLGVGVGFIVISVITPIYNLTSQFK